MKLARIGRAAATAAMAAMAAIAFGEALAQEPAKPVRAVAGAAEQINLVMGKGGLYETSAPFAKISVADEKVVDVTPQSDREFVFTPKAIGATNVFVFSDKNKLIARLDVNVVSPAGPGASPGRRPGPDLQRQEVAGETGELSVQRRELRARRRTGERGSAAGGHDGAGRHGDRRAGGRDPAMRQAGDERCDMSAQRRAGDRRTAPFAPHISFQGLKCENVELCALINMAV